MLKRKMFKKIIFFLSVLSIVIGLSIIGINIINNELEENTANEMMKAFVKIDENTSGLIEENTYSDVTSVTTKSSKINKSSNESYIAVLEIPKINLKRGFFDKESKRNNVNKNVYMLKESEMPIVENSNLILAAHSGNSRVAFFNDLKKLNINDNAIINYKNQKFIYKLINYYEIDKTGKANIVRNKSKTTLTLITCKQNTKKQIIFIFELEKVEGDESE